MCSLVLPMQVPTLPLGGLVQLWEQLAGGTQAEELLLLMVKEMPEVGAASTTAAAAGGEAVGGDGGSTAGHDSGGGGSGSGRAEMAEAAQDAARVREEDTARALRQIMVDMAPETGGLGEGAEQVGLVSKFVL